MTFVASDWSIDRQTKNIRYIGNDHTGAAPSYATVIEFHRALQDFADDAGYTGNDELDITDPTPSERSTDNIVTLINSWNIDDTAAEHIYDGSIVQTGGDVIYDGIKILAPVGTGVQFIQNGAVISDDWWNYSEGGTHTGAANASVLTDGSKSWTTNQWAGYTIKNTTDGSFATIVSNTATTITGTLQGGTENDWDASDAYIIVDGLNKDSVNGISHNFMLKVRTGAADIDGRRLIAITREWGKNYLEFKVNGTTRGINVVALATAADLNNTLSATTVAGYTTITNSSVGYNGIDVDNNGADEFYYSEWNKDTYSINQFYERIKYLTRDGSAATLYGLNGELFRGITHQISVDNPSATDFSAVEAVSWSGGTGQMLAINDVNAPTTMWIQLLTGVTPTDNQVITGGTSGATCQVNVTVTERTVSTPVCGASTGSAIIGAYGFGIEALDLSASDKVFDLTTTQRSAPNYVTFTVAGLVSGDRVLVSNEDTGTIDYNQFVLNGALTGAAVTSVVVTGAIPADTPATGTIRILRADGQYTRHTYSAWSTSTFTIASHDFSSNNAANGANTFISYIDDAASGATMSFTGVYVSDRTLFIRVRDGGGTPIKTFETTGTLGVSGGSTTAIRTSDA
jgi:hypothetical protein